MPEKATVMNVERRTLSAQVYHILERKVLEGELAPGTHISEESLAERYGVSRSPAREALAELERVGLAVRVGGRDRMISIPTAEMIRQKYDLWWILDVGRTYLASLEATQKDHVELCKLVDKMSEAVERNDFALYNRNCEKFHQRFRRHCANQYVNEIADRCDLYLDWFQALYDKEQEFSILVVTEHRNILDAYMRRSLPELSEAIRTHLSRQRERIIALFEEHIAGGNFPENAITSIAV